MMRRMLVIDTIVAIFVNAIVFPVGLRAAGLAPPQAMLGTQGALVDGALATICPIVLMTILMTLVLRARFHRRLPERSAIVVPWAAIVPRPIVLRSLMLAMAGLIVLLPLRLLVIWGLGLLPMTSATHFLLNIAYGSMIGLMFLPMIFSATLAELPETRAGFAG
jgi:hypothetical protein